MYGCSGGGVWGGRKRTTAQTWSPQANTPNKYMCTYAAEPAERTRVPQREDSAMAKAKGNNNDMYVY